MSYVTPFFKGTANGTSIASQKRMFSLELNDLYNVVLKTCDLDTWCLFVINTENWNTERGNSFAMSYQLSCELCFAESVGIHQLCIVDIN